MQIKNNVNNVNNKDNQNLISNISELNIDNKMLTNCEKQVPRTPADFITWDGKIHLTNSQAKYINKKVNKTRKYKNPKEYNKVLTEDEIQKECKNIRMDLLCNVLMLALFMFAFTINSVIFASLGNSLSYIFIICAFIFIILLIKNVYYCFDAIYKPKVVLTCCFILLLMSSIILMIGKNYNKLTNYYNTQSQIDFLASKDTKIISATPIDNGNYKLLIQYGDNQNNVGIINTKYKNIYVIKGDFESNYFEKKNNIVIAYVNKNCIN